MVNMFRGLSLVLVVGALLTTSYAYALGVGDIKINSNLNQPLDAEIEILSPEEGELDGLIVNLASQDSFDRLRLARPFYLTDIRFEVTTRADGTPIIQLTTLDNVREPFLDFLIDVKWSKGRMLREYTVLLDPPISVTSQPSMPPAAIDGPQTIAVTPPPAVSGGTTSPPKPSSPKPSSVAPGSVAPDSVVDESTQQQDDRYGPVQDQETLWSIAERIKSGDVSTQQMLLALFAANPQSFINGNIHRVKKGAILRIPPSSEVNVWDRRAAIEEVRLLNEQIGLVSDVREQAGIPNEVAGQTSTTSSSVPQEDKLKILAAGNSATSATAENNREADNIRNELATATETIASQDLENQELRTRVQELEQTVVQMEELKRLIEVQSQQLARLQSQLASGADETAVDQPPPPVEPSNELPQDAVDLETDTESVPADQVESSEGSEGNEVVVEAEPPPVEAPVELDTPPSPEEPVSAGLLDEVLGYVTQILSGVMDDPMLLGIVVAVVVVIIALVVLINRRRQQDTEDDFIDEEEEVADEPLPDVSFTSEVVEPSTSRFAKLTTLLATLKGKLAFRKKHDDEEFEYEVPDTDVSDAGMPEAKPEAPVASTPAAKPETPVATSSDATDATMQSSAETVAGSETEEAEGNNPLEEADIYEAFGDYGQAAEIIKQAISDQPNNNQFKLRLFKLYQTGDMKNEFSNSAIIYKDVMRDSPEWGEVVAIGQSFAPECPAWADGDVSQAAPVDDAIEMADTSLLPPEDTGFDIDDLDFEIDSTDTKQPEAEQAASPDLTDLDFEPDTSDTPAEGAADDMGDLNFELDEEPADTKQPEAEQAASPDLTDLDFEPDTGDTPAEGAADDMGDLNFELDEEPADTKQPEAEQAASPDLTDLDFEPDTGDTPAEGAADDMGDLNFELDEEPADTKQPEAEQAASPDLTDLDFEPDISDTPAEGAADDMGDLNFELDEEPADTKQPEAEQAASPDLTDLDFEPDTGDTPAEGAADDMGDLNFELDEEAGDSEAVSDDAVGTKLELAQAYIDMGDSEGAKSMLEEVIAEGNEQQKQEAEKLLKTI